MFVSLVTGNLLVYRVFDVGPDFNLIKIENLLSLQSETQRFRLSKPTRSIYITNAPLTVLMGQKTISVDFLKKEFKADLHSKIWAFGAITIVLSISFENLDWEELVQLGTFVESDNKITSLAEEKVESLLLTIDKMRKPELEIIEDYLIYFFKSLPGAETDASLALEKFDFPRLLMTENSGELSPQVHKAIRENLIQYNKNDLAAITWNSAIIVEPTGVSDVADIVEFALCQVLEMRYYDHLLEKKLGSLYDSLENQKFSLWETYSESLSREAARHYLEISETVENVENSLKVIGDFYLAQIFRAASTRFRFNDWRAGVNQKLKNLADISHLINSNLHQKRSQFLELVIIILIAIEVIPFVIGLLK